MKTRSFAVDLLLLASIFFSTSCAAPTPTSLPTASQTPPATETPTPAETQTPAPTPTETPVASEFIDLNIISSIEFRGSRNGVESNLKLSIDRSLDKNHGFDTFIPNESFSDDLNETFTEFTNFFIYETVINTNPNSSDLAYEDFNNKLEYAQNHPDEENAWKGLAITVFNDAMKKDATINPTKDMILEIVSTDSKTDGIKRTGKEFYDGIRVEYDNTNSANTLRIIRAFDTNGVDITAYYLSKQYALLPKLLGRYNGEPIYYPVEQNYIKQLLNIITSKSNYAFKVYLNGRPASDTEAQRNP